MRKHYRWVLIIGVIITILPFVGLRRDITDVVQFVSGLILLILALIERYFVKFHEHDFDKSPFEGDDESDDEDAEEKVEENISQANIFNPSGKKVPQDKYNEEEE